MMRYLLWFVLLFSLSSCASSNQLVKPEPVQMSARVVAECRMLERAFKETEKQTGQKYFSIVQGCPGYEKVRVSSSVLSGAGSFLKAAGASMPTSVQAGGATAKRLYQRMIARGTPAKVAFTIANSPEFKVAVNVANQ